jgi:uncharacterized membrane protein
METKDGLTRDEAREAIKILALRKGNLDNLVVNAIILLIAFGTLFAPFIIALNQNLPHSFFLDFLYFIAMAVVVVFFTSILFRANNSKSKGTEEKMKKLAKDYNLKEFLDAVSGKK